MIGHLTAEQIAATVVLIFCRVGSCVMIAPGISSSEIPMQVRLFIAVTLVLALTPMLVSVAPVRLEPEPVSLLYDIATESAVGALIGLTSRIFFLSLETLAVGLATMLGLSNPFGVQVEPGQSLPPIASIISIAAVALVFFSDLHLELLRGLALSYKVAPIATPFDPAFAVDRLSATLVDAFRISLRICAPFVLYAVVVNLTSAIVNRLTPQIQVFYIATPFIIGGGFILLYFSIGPLLYEFITVYGAWLVRQ